MMRLLRGTATRRVFDRALEALPLTQHGVVWNLYVSWTRSFALPEQAVRVFRRYLMFDPAQREEYVSYLQELGQNREAAVQLMHLLDHPPVTPTRSPAHALWMLLCRLLAQHPLEMRDIDCEGVIRAGTTNPLLSYMVLVHRCIFLSFVCSHSEVQ